MTPPDFSLKYFVLRILIFLLPVTIFAREWTVMVYMAADNGLAAMADSDLIEMEAVGANPDLAVLVQIDRPNIGARRLSIKKGSSETLQELGIIDMCSWETLADFLYWGINNFPARRYLVVLWDHGTGWTEMKHSFGSDWSSGNEMGIANGEFKKAISNLYAYTHKEIDILAFDACLMQEIEVAYEIKDYAKLFLASQTIMPIQGFRYDKILQVIEKKPDIDEIELAKKIIEINIENYQGVQPLAMSAINLKQLEDFKNKFNELLTLLFSENQLSEIKKIRKEVQTIPGSGYQPDSTDENIDLGDFIGRIAELKTNLKVKTLLDVYNYMIISSDFWGNNFSHTTGISIWFPYDYLIFKKGYTRYRNLDWAASKWLKFLNWFYDKDDIRPSPVTVKITKPGNGNSLELFWNPSFDLAPVNYYVVEANDTITLFQDGCEDFRAWNVSGFVLNSEKVHTGNYSFFSTNYANADYFIESHNPIKIDGLGLLTLYLNYNTEEMTDSLIITYGNFQDVFYGSSSGWVKRHTLLPSGNFHLRISYHSNENINSGGCYIDDIKVENLYNGRIISPAITRNRFNIYNKLKGRYLYAVYPVDYYKNSGNLSNFVETIIKNYAVPYSNPSPFQKDCNIILDYPDSLNPTVEIFSITGRRVRKFLPRDISTKKIYWDGKDQNNKTVGAGIYFVLLYDGTFKKVGKIAHQ